MWPCWECDRLDFPLEQRKQIHEVHEAVQAVLRDMGRFLGELLGMLESKSDDVLASGMSAFSELGLVDMAGNHTCLCNSRRIMDLVGDHLFGTIGRLLSGEKIIFDCLCRDLGLSADSVLDGRSSDDVVFPPPPQVPIPSPPQPQPSPIPPRPLPDRPDIPLENLKDVRDGGFIPLPVESPVESPVTDGAGDEVPQPVRCPSCGFELPPVHVSVNLDQSLPTPSEPLANDLGRGFPVDLSQPIAYQFQFPNEPWKAQANKWVGGTQQELQEAESLAEHRSILSRQFGQFQINDLDGESPERSEADKFVDLA